MKQACATLIKKCALIHFPVHSTEVVGKNQQISFFLPEYKLLILISYINNVVIFRRLARFTGRKFESRGTCHKIESR